MSTSATATCRCPPRLQRWARDTIAADIDAIGTVARLVLLAAAILAKYGTALFA